MERSEFKHSTLFILLGALLAGLLGLYLGGQLGGRAPVKLASEGVLFQPPRTLAPFELQRPDGSPLTVDALKGRWSVLFFGFRNCPDICPATLAQMAALERHLDETLPAARRPQFVFISLDPARDAGAPLGEYTGYFSPRFLAGTTPEPAIKAFATLFGAAYEVRPPDASGAYAVDHSPNLFLTDPEGRYAGFIKPPRTAQGELQAFDLKLLAQDLEALTR